jgi:hypothetical protein
LDDIHGWTGRRGGYGMSAAPKSIPTVTPPSELRALRAWLTWTYEPEPNGGKPRKVPYYTNGIRRHGRQGSEEDRAQLTTYDTAREAAQQRGHGIGLAMLPDHDMTGVDFDNCVNDGVVPPDIHELCAPSYAEYSPSGSGVRAFFRGRVQTLRTAGLEAYSDVQFLTVTGWQISGAAYAVVPLTNAMRAYIEARRPARSNSLPAARSDSVNASASNDPIPEGERDNTLNAMAFRAYKAGFDHAAVLAALRHTNATRCNPPLNDSDIERLSRPRKEATPELQPWQVGFGSGPIPVGMLAVPTPPNVVQQQLSVEMAALHPIVLAEIRAAAPDTLFLSNDHLEPNAAAERIFAHLGTEREMYRRGDAVVELNLDKRLISMSSTMFRSRLNRRGRRVRAFKVDKKGHLLHAPKLCSEDEAKLLLGTSAVEFLPEIKLVARMPVLVEREGALITTQPGYNADCGVLVTSNVAIPTVPLDAAATALLDLLRDFLFPEPGDKARALAGFVAPGLRMGGLLHSDALITSMEADQSQAGKGFKLKIDRAIYGEPAYPVAQKEGGVGSFDESLAQALLSGAPFVNFDNLRGNVCSAYLESIITAGTDRVPVRVPHKGEAQVDITRTSFQLTSNGFHSTVDLSNRLLMVRLLKQPADYAFTQYPEGGLLQRVEKYSAYYLGCVHTVIRHWHAAGKPCLTTEHTFKEWVGTLDWIVQDVWQSVPLLEGHRAAAARIASPSLSWLRQLAFVVLREGRGGQELRTGDLRELCERCDLMPDGIKPSWEENAIERAMGRLLASCFAKGDSLELDSIRVTRVERKEKDANYMLRGTKFYTFQAA